jgi:hypothetical protein
MSTLNRAKQLGNETLFWLELLVDAGVVERAATKDLIAECHELLRIFAASLTTAKANR